MKSIIVNEILEIIRKKYSTQEEGLSHETHLVKEGIIDSMSVVDLITELEAKYQVSFNEDDFLNQNLLIPCELAAIIFTKTKK